MDKHIFLEHSTDQNINIIFLCGVKFRNNDNDKRIVLKKFLSKLDNRNNVVILEENFIFGKSNKKFLAYDEIFMKDLNSVETLTALFSDLVLIIHESNSTAAELGMFATNDLLYGKLCLLVPDEYSIEENNISNFFKLAFFKGRNDIGKIIFYPSTEVWRSSTNKSNFRTYFSEDAIGENLSKNIKNFINTLNIPRPCIKIIKAPYNKHLNDINTVSYIYNKYTKKIDIRLSTEIIKCHVISFFNLNEFRIEIRKNKELIHHITFIEQFYKTMLINTLEYKEGYNITSADISIKGTNLKFRYVIAYFLYLLQAMKKIKFIQNDIDESLRRVQIETDFQKIYKQYKDFIGLINESLLGGMNK